MKACILALAIAMAAPACAVHTVPVRTVSVSLDSGPRCHPSRVWNGRRCVKKRHWRGRKHHKHHHHRNR